MCLIKKHKKYQYLYLLMWLNSDDLEHDLELANAGGNSKLNTRKFYKWLEKINKKYNYDI